MIQAKIKMKCMTNERAIRKARKLLKQLEKDKISSFEKAQRFFIIQESLLKK